MVPGTTFAWGKEAVAEVVERHEAVGVGKPKFFYTQTVLVVIASQDSSHLMILEQVWLHRGTQCSVKLDAMHLMLRIGREVHARHSKFLVDLSMAIFVQHQGDRKSLMAAQQAAHLEGPTTRTGRVKYIRRIVGLGYPLQI